MLNYIITDATITILINGLPQIVDNTHPMFDKIKQGIKNDISEVELLELIDTKVALEKYSQGKVSVKDGEVFYGEYPIRNALTERILTMLDEGFNIDSMCKFMDNLFDNPSKTSIDELYLFLESCKLPITEDGHFLAYKKVRNDYMDIYSGTFDNSIGQVCEMERNDVNDDRNQTCSAGLHFASYSYMSSYGNTGGSDRIVIVKINPADVVSIPSDYNNAKGRCWRYEVVNEVDNDGKTQIKNDCIKNEDTYHDDYVDNSDDTSLEEFDNMYPDTSYMNYSEASESMSESQKYNYKEFKRSIVQKLYSYEIDLEKLIKIVNSESPTVLNLSNELNFNQSVNVIRDFLIKENIDPQLIIDRIDNGEADVKHVSVSETDTLGDVVADFLFGKSEIKKIVNGVKDGSITWTRVENLLGVDEVDDIKKFNDYGALKKKLKKSLKSGKITDTDLEVFFR
jgi:hypothetical protein